MKAKHNVILILVSSKWLIPYSGDSSKFLISFVHFSFRSSKLFQLYHFKASSNHCKASPCVVNFSFFLSSFYYRSSSWRLYMVLRQGFLSFFNCSSRFLSESRSVKLYSKINMVLNTCLSWGVQAFFISHSEVQFFLPYLLRWCYVILDNFPSGSWFTKFSRVTYLNPSFYLRSRDLFNQSIFLLELYWVIFHL